MAKRNWWPKILRGRARPALPAPETKSLSLDDTVVNSGRPRGSTLDAMSLIKDRVELSSWVYDCVRLRAQSLASVRWFASQVTSEGEATPLDPTHPLNVLLRKANKHWPFSELQERAQMQLDATGNVYITKLKIRGTTRELWVMPPGSVKPIPSDSGNFIDGYEVNINGKVQMLAPEDVIHLQYPNPSDAYVGLSPMSAALQAIDLDVRAVEWNRNLIENRAVAETAITYPKPMSQRAYDEVLERLGDQHMGPESAGRPWVLDGGATLQSFGATPRDMDWLASRRFNREEICSIFAVPPPLVGIFDQATYNNIETADRMFWQNGMTPVLRRWQDSLTMSLASEYGSDIRVDFDVSHISAMQAVTSDAVDTAAKLWAMGVPMNTINATLNLGLPETPEGDIGYISSSLTPVAVNGEFDGAFEAIEDEIDEAIEIEVDEGEEGEEVIEDIDLDEEVAVKRAELSALRAALRYERDLLTPERKSRGGTLGDQAAAALWGDLTNMTAH